jgi:protein TonB
VEVIAHGSRSQTIRTRNPINLDLQHESAAAPALAIAGTGPETIVTDAAEQVRLSPGTAELVLNPVKPSYPLLARQMKVQGSVVLQARIGKDGNIQNLQVLKGPEILSNAALDAVRQWRFKPQYQAGQAVESDTRITVDFIISTH